MVELRVAQSRCPLVERTAEKMVATMEGKLAVSSVSLLVETTVESMVIWTVVRWAVMTAQTTVAMTGLQWAER